MHKNLYDIFKNWYHGGQIYVYSDPHFNDSEANSLRTRYIGDDEQVKRINAKIGKNDTLIILGDIGDTDYVKKLRGYKVLIMGNHDKGASNYQRIVNSSSALGSAERLYDNRLFDEVYEGPLMISEKLILSHEPIIGLNFAFNIHGHDHNKATYFDYYHMNVCAEHIDYTPVCLKHIIESGKLSRIKSIHRQTIDDATEKANKRK